MDDLINRKDAIAALGERPMVWTDSDYEIAQRNQYDMDKLAIETVPSAQPERKTGKWTKISPASIYECSVCGQNIMTQDIDVYSYCHGCGAKMEVRK